MIIAKDSQQKTKKLTKKVLRIRAKLSVDGRILKAFQHSN